MSKRYLIERSEDGVNVLVQGTGLSYPLGHLVLHSPSGFEYGYNGSGPADLALSIAADLLDEHPSHEQLARGDSYAWIVHHRVKDNFIVPLEHNVRQHELDGDEVFSFIQHALHNQEAL